MKRELDSVVTQMHAAGFTYAEAIREFKRRFIQETLFLHKGNQCKAAKALGMHRNTLSRTMVELDLNPTQIKEGLKRPVGSARPLVNARPLDSYSRLARS